MQRERSPALFARKAFTSEGWQENVLIAVDGGGMITGVEKTSAPPAGTPSFDLILPGMSNVHSHAFQRAMAGLTEIASGKGKENFWSWREAMYGFTQNLTPEQIETIARALYIELLKQGYTAVGEFHYVHHDANGKPYAAVTELSDRVIAGAQAAGIHLTHLPVMYETSNFGGAPAHDGQRRFVHSAEHYLKLIEALSKRYGRTDGVTLGIAPHSLRAVTQETLQTIVQALPGMGLGNCPIHIHVAEQEKEIADCVSWSKERPVEWLMNHHAVDRRWCLIHATHTNANEIARMAKSGAVVGLCPTTEANLGDGIFPAESYLQAGGNFGVGSDSNVCMSPWEELRLMEYAQRLSLKKRNVLCSETTPSVGRTLFAGAAKGGAQALGIKAGQIAVGYRADMMALSTAHPLMAERKGDTILDTLIFGTTPNITDVFVAGRRVIEGGRHALEIKSAKN